MGGDIVYIVSKNSVVAGPSNVAYGAAKADQAHQVRLLAAELGPLGIRSTGSTPMEWCAGRDLRGRLGRAAGRRVRVPESELGAFYAKRTLLGRSTAGARRGGRGGADRRRPVLTTGLHIPVDAGVAAGFLR